MMERFRFLWRDKRPRAVLLFAVASRVAFALFFGASVSGSGRRYVDPAAAMISGDWKSPQIIDQLPGAPVFFIPFFVVFGERYGPVVVGQHLLGLAALCLLMALALEAWGERACAWAGWLIASQLILPYQECFLLSESVGQFWLAAALYLAVSFRLRPPGARGWALAGGAAAMAGLTRGELVLLGPAAALLLALPVKGLRPLPLSRAAVFLAAWAAGIGAWTLRNAWAGYADFNSHGHTVLLDTAMPLVRYDLPTEPLVKRVLKEQVEFCAAHPCDPRPTTLLRLQKEFGYSYLDARRAFGRVARETFLTQPLKFLPFVLKNLLSYFTPMPWVSAETLDQQKPIRDSIGDSAARRAFWRTIEAGPQYLGWAPLALACLAPLALALQPASKGWAAAVALTAALVIAGTASFFRAVARTQADLYLPLGLLGAFSADALIGRLRKN